MLFQNTIFLEKAITEFFLNILLECKQKFIFFPELYQRPNITSLLGF